MSNYQSVPFSFFQKVAHSYRNAAELVLVQFARSRTECPSAPIDVLIPVRANRRVVFEVLSLLKGWALSRSHRRCFFRCG
jgi:hypothetical protein